MKELRGRLIERVRRTATVESFRFALPAREGFLPGQFLQVVFDERRRDNKDLNKYLSISSWPGAPYIEVTKRLSASEFSLRLNGLKINDEVLVRMPMGACVFRDGYRKIGFLIGGIGITPVISIIGHIIHRHLDTDVSLFYSNRTEEEIAFKKEIDSWQEGSRNIKVFYTVTDCQPQDKTCFFGTITKDFLLREAKDLQERILFIFGPPRMVEFMRTLSLELGCKEENIKTESFIGY